MLFPHCSPPRCCCCLISQCCALSYTYINIDNEPERERERERVQISGVTCRGACAFIQHKYKYKHGWVTAVEGTEKEERRGRQVTTTDREAAACRNERCTSRVNSKKERERGRETLLSSTYLSYTHKQRAHGFAVLILLCRWHSLTV